MAKKTAGYPSLIETIGEVSSTAETKCRLSYGQLIILGFIAAAYLALGTTLALAAGATIQSASVQKLLMGAVFPVGLIAVVVAGSELSTGNYLTTPLGAMTSCVKWSHVLRNWATSYAGNFLGAFLLAVIVIQGAHIGKLWGQPWVDLLTKVATQKAHLAPLEAFWRGFLCIWLVDLAIWQSYRVKDYAAKFLLIWFPTFAFFTLGLEHSVVNMFLFPAAIFGGAAISWQQFLLNNLLPVVVGNVVGGLFIVGMLYWFSAGLPRRLGSGVAEGGYKGDLDVPDDHVFTHVLAVTALRGASIAAVFLAVFPGGGAALSFLLPRSWGIAIPIVVMAYLAIAAFVFSVFLTTLGSRKK
ncbi:MAG: formate/nitrite transporter family protein [Chloroflexi bacterium]|nr:formate/nitrite transporter family protein [Chloroflexota bacterium]